MIKKISNIELLISNIEGMYAVYFKRRLSDTRCKRLRCASETILRNSAVQDSIFDIRCYTFLNP